MRRPPPRSGRAGRPPLPAVVLVAHGSADPAAAGCVRALAVGLAAARPGLRVRASFLEHTRPRPEATLVGLAAVGVAAVVMVPLLFTAAYHGRVDLPAALAAARRDGLRLPVRVTDGLGPSHTGPVPAALLAGLRRRLREAAGSGPAPYDAVVLAAAGTRDPVARATVDTVATRLGEQLGVPTLAGYASAAAPTPAGAVAALREAGARRVAVAAYFLAPGRLYRAAEAGARRAGAVAVARPLGNAPELRELLLQRLDSAVSPVDDFTVSAGTAERPGIG